MKKKSFEKEQSKLMTVLFYVLISVILAFFFLVLFNPFHFIVVKDFENRFVPPNGWHISETSWITVDKYDDWSYQIYVVLRNNDENWCWTNDFVEYNYKTKKYNADFSLGYGYEGICE